ncbi:beta/gamma crystallin domain-containing protein 2-like [Carcharodon carcharias]|uniref:beta/gamma crystallin domain-containing protein 2-like n=1 Tax=Carcharodon carcharias TaxID=13397 RepID=UPI001B7D9194|nr:beta/gamma crystallin domain-containing protein 2-like [Carcharodon carcharias]
MAETSSPEQEKPAGPVPTAQAEECHRNAAGVPGTPLRLPSHYPELGCGTRGEIGKHHQGHITALPPRDPGYSRILDKTPDPHTESQTSLLKLVSLPRPVQQAGGVESNRENTRKVGIDNFGTMSTSSQLGAETAEHLSTDVSSQIAGSPDSSLTSNSRVQQQSNGGPSDDRSGMSGSPDSFLRLSIADSRNKVSEGSVVNGSDLPLSGNPTQSSSAEHIGSHSTMNSVLYVREIGSDSAQQPSKESQLDRGDVLQNVNSSGRAQLINTLHQLNPDQNGLISEMRHSPISEESVPARLKLDQVPGPQPIKSPLLNSENGSLQKTLKYSLDSFKADTIEKPLLDSKTAVVQNPAEDSKDFQARSFIVVNPGSQAQTFRYTSEKTGQEESGDQQLQPTGSLILENELSSTNTFIQNQRDKWPANVSDDPDGLSEIDGFADAIRNLDSPMLLSRNKGPRNQRTLCISPPFATLPPIEEDQTNPKNPLSSPNAEKPQQLSGILVTDGKPLSSLPSQPVSPVPRIDFSKTPKKEILTPLEMMKMQLEEKPRIGIQRASAENSIVFQSSLLGRTNLAFNANSENKEPLGAENKWSRLSNSMLYSNYKKPLESFSSSSDHSLKSITASSISPSTTLPNLIHRSLSYEGGSTTTMATDQQPTTFIASMFEGGLMDTRRPSLPSSISERLMTGYSSLSDTSRKLQSSRISLPSDLGQHAIANGKPRTITAFPDVWKRIPKDQGKINPRPGKIIIYDKPNFTGFQREISCDVPDCSSWPFPAVISVRVIRGCWVAYEKSDFNGKKFIFGEEDIELMDPWSEEFEDETEDPDSKPPPTKPIIIGSIRRAVRDYTIPQISLFPDANGEGKKLSFYGESEDIRIFGFPPRTTSIVVNSGLWLVYSEPFFEGQQSTLEVGGYRTLEEWRAEKAQVGSLMPVQMGPPRVEKPYEPKISIFEKPHFTGRSREVYSDSSDFLSRYPNTGAALSNAGSIKVYGGIWVGYSKEGFRGHQYLLEEGEFLDWRSWGGCDEDLKSLRVIRADFSNPAIVLNENKDDKGKDSFMMVESVPDLEPADVDDIIQSIHVLSGVWVAYEGVNYSGSQYIVEKGIYRNPQDWGAQNCKISSLHPILQVEPIDQQLRLKIKVYSESEFSGRCLILEKKKIGIPREFKMQSCRVLNGSWALYEGQAYDGRVFVVGEGEYPDLQSMGCRMTTHIRSVKAIPHVFSEPSVTLCSLENFEGKEIELNSEVKNLLSDGYNNLVLSLRVNGGVWVLYEYSNFRGRQVLLEPIEISNWPKYSGFSRIGSLSPVSQKPAFFQIKNKETKDFLSVTVCQEDVKSGRVIVASENKELEQIWFYENGLLKPKFAPDVSLQTIGTVTDAGSKVVLWSEKRIPSHCWTFEMSGTIQSLLYEGLVLDIKGGKSYDRDSAMICKSDDENPTQQWEIQML